MTRPIVTLDVLVIAPSRFRMKGRVLTATPAEQARARDMAERFAGIMDACTGGALRVRTHLVDPAIVFDVCDHDDPSRDRWRPTLEKGPPGQIHEGAARAWGKSLGITRYPMRLFLSPYSVLPTDWGDLCWGTWAYLPVRADEYDPQRLQTEPMDALPHAVAHLLQFIARRRKAPFTPVNPDEAGAYGQPRELDRLGWLPFLTEALSGTARRPGGTGREGMTPARWRQLFPSSAFPPITPAPGVTILPFLPVTPGEPWVSGSRRPAPVVTTPTRRPRAS